jgi:hypothetical protein
MHYITFVQNENMSVAEAKALEEAIQLSLTESSRRASRGESFYGGFGAGGNDCDSGYTSLAASSKSHWAEVRLCTFYRSSPVLYLNPVRCAIQDGIGDSSDAASKADELALQTAIMLSLTETASADYVHTARSTDDSGLTPRPPAEAAYDPFPAEPVAPVNRQYPYNLSPELRRKSSFHVEDSHSRQHELRRTASYGTPTEPPRHGSAQRSRPPPPEYGYPSPRPSPRTDEEGSTPIARPREVHPRALAPPPLPLPAAPLAAPRYEEDLSPRRGERPARVMQRDLSERTTGSFMTPRSESNFGESPQHTHRSETSQRTRIPPPPPPPYGFAEDSGNEYRRPAGRSASAGRPFAPEREYSDRRYPRDEGEQRYRHQYHEEEYRYRQERHGDRDYPRRPVNYDHFPSEEARIASGYNGEYREKRPSYSESQDRRPLERDHERARYAVHEESHHAHYEARSSSAPRGGRMREGPYPPYDGPVPMEHSKVRAQYH